MLEQNLDVYDSEMHSNPKQVVQWILEILGLMPGATIPLVHAFWGSSGIGKTTLLDALGSANELTALILGKWDARITSAADLMQQILAKIAQSTERRKIVLIDNLDALLRQEDGSDFFDFEHLVIRNLVERNDTLIVVTSQSELRQWREYEVRERLHSIHLLPLAASEIEPMDSYSAEQIYALTLGHPQVIQWLRDAPNLTEQALAQKARDHFFQELADETQPLARASCLFPMFDVAMLRLVLPSQAENASEGFYIHFLERIRDLAGAGLIYWNAESGSYRYADNSVRCLCARALFYEQPDEFRRIHQIAFDYFQSDALRATYLHFCFVSAIYHLAYTIAAQASAPVGASCLEWVRAHQEQWIGADWDAVISAWETGQGDAGTLEEIKSLLGSEAFAEISRALQESKHKFALPA
ncbi:MAG: ATP-binding protein [Chloroflexi bacterium]|nr:ATP-binding protein [Chloroflexota bacterium]